MFFQRSLTKEQHQPSSPNHPTTICWSHKPGCNPGLPGLLPTDGKRHCCSYPRAFEMVTLLPGACFPGAWLAHTFAFSASLFKCHLLQEDLPASWHQFRRFSFCIDVAPGCLASMGCYRMLPFEGLLFIVLCSQEGLGAAHFFPMEDPTDKARPGALKEIKLHFRRETASTPALVPERPCRPGLPATDRLGLVELGEPRQRQQTFHPSLRCSLTTVEVHPGTGRCWNLPAFLSRPSQAFTQRADLCPTSWPPAHGPH